MNRERLWLLLLPALLVMAAGVCAAAREGLVAVGPDGRAVVRQASGEPSVSVGNGYLKVFMGRKLTEDQASQWINVSCFGDEYPDTPIAMNWSLMATGGDPDVTGDENLPMVDDTEPLTPSPYATRPVLAVDVGTDNEQVFKIGDVSGVFTQDPVADEQKALLKATWRDADETLVEVQEGLRLMRDLVRVEFKITNLDSRTHSFGFRQNIDIRPNANQNCELGDVHPESPIFVDGLSPIVDEAEIAGADVPTRVFAYRPTTGSESLLGMHLAGFQDATRPDLVQFWTFNPVDPTDAEAENEKLSAWTVEVDDTKPLEDTIVSLAWDPRYLSKGQSVTYVFYIGLIRGSGDYTDPYVLAATSPLRITAAAGDDPTTPETEAVHYSPNPFPITGFIYNLGILPRTGAVLQITLPTGLALEPGETAIKQVGDLGPQAEGQATWMVRATGQASGPVSVAISGNVSPSYAKTIARTIVLDPLALRSVVRGVQMISVPFALSDPDPATALVLPPFSSLEMARWDADLQGYRYYPDPFLSWIKSGQAYWLKLATAGQLGLAGASLDTSTSQYLVDLKRGWNQIGNPFPRVMQWGRVMVVGAEDIVDLTEACIRGWIRPSLFSWDPAAGQYVYPPGGALDFELQPWEGYWIKANTPCQLLFLRDQLDRGPVQTSTRLAETPGAGWSATLRVAEDGGGSAYCTIGAAERATNGWDLLDLDCPPAASGNPSLAVVHQDWGGNSGAYLRDLRSAGSATQSWEIECVASAPGVNASLRWDDLRQVSREVRLLLEDLDTGQRVQMRTSEAYGFNAGEAGRRRFRVTTAPAWQGALAMSPLRCESTRGAVGFVFEVSAAATIEVAVENLLGQPVKVLLQRSVEAGPVQCAWDGLDAGGRRAAPGQYICRVRALAEDGQQVSGFRVFEWR
jgi:hypothetical protein